MEVEAPSRITPEVKKSMGPQPETKMQPHPKEERDSDWEIHLYIKGELAVSEESYR